MSCFLRGTKQHTTEESNSSMLITKVVILIDLKHKHVKVILWKSIIELYGLYFLCIYIFHVNYKNKYFYNLFKQVRWVVESANGRIKRWKYLDRTVSNTQIPFIGDYVRIVAAISNKYCPPLNSGAAEDDQAIASKMLYLSQKGNALRELVENEGWDRRSSLERWMLMMLQRIFRFLLKKKFATLHWELTR